MNNPDELTPIIDQLQKKMHEENKPSTALRLNVVVLILDAIRREDSSHLDITISSVETPKFVL